MTDKKKHKTNKDSVHIYPDDIVFIPTEEIIHMEKTLKHLERMEQDWINYRKKYDNER